jgi:hypothetical protein
VESGISGGIVGAKDHNAYLPLAAKTLQDKYGLSESAARGALHILAQTLRPGVALAAPVPAKPQAAPPAGHFPIKSNKKLVKIIALAASVIIVVLIVVAVAAGNSYKADVSPIVEFRGNAFPSQILATASMKNDFNGKPRMITAKTGDGSYLGDDMGDFGISLKITKVWPQPASGPVPVKLEITGDHFIKESSLEAQVQAGKTVELFPLMLYDYQALSGLKEAQTVNVKWRVFLNNSSRPYKEISQVVRFHSINECPFREVSRWDNKTMLDNTWLFAAYVNEDDPLIDGILKEALQINTAKMLGYGNSFIFSGYQDLNNDGKTAPEVNAQVLAIWNVFRKRGIKYSNIATTSTANQDLYSQYVRSLSEAFNDSQANCVDGSVLFASVLRRLGIEPFLVLIPGHMFLGYYTRPDKSKFDFLETTMLGDGSSARKTWTVRNAEDSLKAFEAAQKTGEDEWAQVKSLVADPMVLDYEVIDIASLRAAGVMPLETK